MDRFLRVTFFLGHTNPCQQNILSVTTEEGVAATDILTAMEKMEKHGDAKVKWVCVSPTSWIRKMGCESVTWFSRWQWDASWKSRLKMLDFPGGAVVKNPLGSKSLGWEDPTCRRPTKPVRHNYWACALEPTSHNYWACVPQLLKPAHLEPVLLNQRSHCNEKPAHRNEE